MFHCCCDYCMRSRLSCIRSYLGGSFRHKQAKTKNPENKEYLQTSKDLDENNKKKSCCSKPDVDRTLNRKEIEISF